MALLDFGVRKRLAMRSVSQPFVLPVSTKYSPNFICFRRSLKPATFSCSYKQLCAADKRASEQEKEGHERVSVNEPFACAFLPSFFFPDYLRRRRDWQNPPTSGPNQKRSASQQDYLHTCICTHIQSHARALSDTHRHTDTDTDRRRQTQTHTRAHMHMHTHTHTHTNIDHVCLCAHGGCQRCRKQLLK